MPVYRYLRCAEMIAGVLWERYILLRDTSEFPMESSTDEGHAIERRLGCVEHDLLNADEMRHDMGH